MWGKSGREKLLIILLSGRVEIAQDQPERLDDTLNYIVHYWVLALLWMWDSLPQANLLGSGSWKQGRRDSHELQKETHTSWRKGKTALYK